MDLLQTESGKRQRLCVTIQEKRRHAMRETFRHCSCVSNKTPQFGIDIYAAQQNTGIATHLRHSVIGVLLGKLSDMLNGALMDFD